MAKVRAGVTALNYVWIVLYTMRHICVNDMYASGNIAQDHVSLCARTAKCTSNKVNEVRLHFLALCQSVHACTCIVAVDAGDHLAHLCIMLVWLMVIYHHCMAALPVQPSNAGRQWGCLSDGMLAFSCGARQLLGNLGCMQVGGWLRTVCMAVPSSPGHALWLRRQGQGFQVRGGRGNKVSVGVYVQFQPFTC